MASPPDTTATAPFQYMAASYRNAWAGELVASRPTAVTKKHATPLIQVDWTSSVDRRLLTNGRRFTGPI